VSDAYVSVHTCPECGRHALYALDQDGWGIYLDPEARDGDLAANDDSNHVPWCRPAKPGTQLELGEYLVSLHVCPIAPVIPLTARTRTRFESRRRYA
jgi:hypothetical protein